MSLIPFKSDWRKIWPGATENPLINAKVKVFDAKTKEELDDIVFDATGVAPACDIAVAVDVIVYDSAGIQMYDFRIKPDK